MRIIRSWIFCFVRGSSLLGLGLLLSCSLAWVHVAHGQSAQERSVSDAARAAMVGDALLTQGAYSALATLSDRFGPRMVGTPGHASALDWLEAELAAHGLAVHRDTFSFPGWQREEDEAVLLAPVERSLRAVALGYTGAYDPAEGDVLFVDRAARETLDPSALSGRVLLLAPNLTFSAEEQAGLAAAGVKGLLLINRVDGGQVLARVANRTGTPTPFPVFSISEEEGSWMRRLIEKNVPVRVRLATTSRTVPMTGTNLIATLPGTSGRKIVVGAHFDSWDLGQGALDNGLGVAQVLEAARLLARHHPDNRHTVEFVWFDAEELGLWGARHYARDEPLDAVRVMLNLDMVGRPLGFNAMGFDELVPVLEEIQSELGVWRFSRALANEPWLGSDHQPFILSGVPAVTFYAPIDASASRYYHDFADTFDKVSADDLTEASAIVALTVLALANDTTALRRYTPSETAALVRAAGLEDRLRAMGQWLFGASTDRTAGE